MMKQVLIFLFDGYSDWGFHTSLLSYANATHILILPGGYTWEKGELWEVDDLVKTMATNYKDDESYIEAEAVADQNIITAGGIYPIDFAKAILTKLDPTDKLSANKWFQLFKHGVWVK